MRLLNVLAGAATVIFSAMMLTVTYGMVANVAMRAWHDGYYTEAVFAGCIASFTLLFSIAAPAVAYVASQEM